MKYLALTLLLLAGCSHHHAHERFKVTYTPEDARIVLEWQSSVSQGLLLYYTKSKAIERTSPFSTLYVGEMESVPDSNSIDAVSDSVIPMLFKILKGK